MTTKAARMPTTTSRDPRFTPQTHPRLCRAVAIVATPFYICLSPMLTLRRITMALRMRLWGCSFGEQRRGCRAIGRLYRQCGERRAAGLIHLATLYAGAAGLDFAGQNALLTYAADLTEPGRDLPLPEVLDALHCYARQIAVARQLEPFA